MTASIARPLIPLPTLTLPVFSSASSSRRVQMRFGRLLNSCKVANSCIVALNKLYSPKISQANVSFPSSPQQSRFTGSIFQAARQWVSRLSPEKCDDVLSAVPVSLDSVLPSYQIRQSALPIIADRISIPDKAGSVPLLPSLPADVAASYASLANSFTAQSPDAARSARAFGSRAEYLKLIRRLMDANMIAWTTKPRVVNSVFCVRKADGRLRFILDARPANRISPDPLNPDLPSPTLLAELAASSDCVYIAKADLSDAFFLFAVPADWYSLFAMPPVKPSELQLSGFPSDAFVYPCLTVLPMGWSHSCYLLQQAHMKLALSVFPASDFITGSNDRRLDRVRLMLYLDDLTFLGPDRALVDAALDSYLDACSKNRFLVKQSKCSRAAPHGDSLGFDIDGVSGRVGLSVNKLQQLRVKTFALLRRTFVSGLDLSQLVGAWTWAALVRRPALSIFCSVYRFIEAAGRRVFRLWDSVRRELQIMADIAPLLFASMRQPSFNTLVACDASSTGMGVVAAPVDVASLCSASLSLNMPNTSVSGSTRSLSGLNMPNTSVSGSTRSLPEGRANCGDPNGKTYDENRSQSQGKMVFSGSEELSSPALQHAVLATRLRALDSDFVRSRSWRTIVSHRDRFAGDHINVRELRALSLALRWLASHPTAVGARVALVSDSLVALFSLIKGRSSAFRLLARLRKIAVVMLAARLQVFAFWIPSADNPADAPSRCDA
jgi:hypothetical protein